MLHDDITPPQQYLLQVIRDETPEPKISVFYYTDVMQDSGEVLHSTEKHIEEIEHGISNLGEPIRSGPSVSLSDNFECVGALHVLKPIPEIQNWTFR
ncbi:hypothetical protein DPMN_171637 [Dreissena polymorpha]|uniref:Uncharacterized protein n=1 Tax=Dreissena polymorpha TaxID=45954 RepID=A0A9D4DYD0_DREPO|nr:hypothetical protein DPMN_171637 [Dreissena polymorpha]